MYNVLFADDADLHINSSHRSNLLRWHLSIDFACYHSTSKICFAFCVNDTFYIIRHNDAQYWVPRWWVAACVPQHDL